MNKAVHALVYVILAVAGVALYFEMNLSEKKELLTDSNKQLRNCIVKLSSFIEAEDVPSAPGGLEAKKDIAPLVAREVEDDTVNLLENYPAGYEEEDRKCLDWKEEGKEYGQLRKVYKLDAEGKKQINTNKSGDGKRVYIQEGTDTAQELIDKLILRASKQKEVLKNTRVELKNLREKLQALANDYNKLPPEIRQNKIDLEKKDKEIETLTKEKAEVEENLQKSQDEVKELKSEVLSLKEEVTAAKDETIAAKEALDKAKETIDNMKAILQKRTAEPRAVAGPVTGGGQLTIGDKGTIQTVNNEKRYAVVKFDDAALDELIGSDRNGALPPHEMLVVRVDEQQQKKSIKIIAKIRLRQWMPKTNLVTADILADWQQEPIQVNDVVRPD